MNEALFQGSSVTSNRIIYTPSVFARTSLHYLQEVGQLQAVKAHTSSRSELSSYLFFVVTSGSGELIYHNTRYILTPGTSVFIDCRQPYSHSPYSHDLWSLQWIHFSGTAMPGIYEKYIERGGQPVLTPDQIDQYLALLSDLMILAASDDFIRDMKINEKITSLLTLIMSESWHPDTTVKSGSKKQSLHHIKTYLDEHYQEHITLDFLAEHFFINKYYLTRVFKEQFGTTILSYLDQVRVNHAKRLLRFSNLTAEEIGRSIGIEDPAYFNRVFKKVEGTNPSEYRKRW